MDYASLYIPPPEEIDRKLGDIQLLRLQKLIDRIMARVIRCGTPLIVYIDEESTELHYSQEELETVVGLLQRAQWQCRIGENTPKNVRHMIHIARANEELLVDTSCASISSL